MRNYVNTHTNKRIAHWTIFLTWRHLQRDEWKVYHLDYWNAWINKWPFLLKFLKLIFTHTHTSAYALDIFPWYVEQGIGEIWKIFRKNIKRINVIIIEQFFFEIFSAWLSETEKVPSLAITSWPKKKIITSIVIFNGHARKKK